MKPERTIATPECSCPFVKHVLSDCVRERFDNHSFAKQTSSTPLNSYFVTAAHLVLHSEYSQLYAVQQSTLLASLPWYRLLHPTVGHCDHVHGQYLDVN